MMALRSSEPFGIYVPMVGAINPIFRVEEELQNRGFVCETLCHDNECIFRRGSLISSSRDHMNAMNEFLSTEWR